MSFEVFSELYQLKHLLPELDMAVNTEGYQILSLWGSDHIVDCLLMHETQLIEIGCGKTIKKKLMDLGWSQNRGTFL